MMNNQWYKPIVTIILILLLTACSTSAPPREFAPDGEILEKALLLQLNQTEQRLSQQLNAIHPQMKISNIKVKTLEPVYIGELPAYHLQGTYTLDLTLPRQDVTQKNNRFEIYLQRQIEGKTWRLLKRDVTPTESQWSSYLVQ